MLHILTNKLHHSHNVF